MMAQVLYLPWRCSIPILILVPDQREDSRVAASDFGLVHSTNAFEDTGMVAAPKLQRMMLSTGIATAEGLEDALFVHKLCLACTR